MYWFTVGVFLKVPYHTLNSIKINHGDQSKVCLREMLAAWLKGSEASPAAMVRALIAGGNVVIAKRLAAKYGETIDYCHRLIITTGFCVWWQEYQEMLSKLLERMKLRWRIALH